MANKYGIPEGDLEKIRARDKNCVYCHKKMLYPFVKKKQGDSATIEHLNYIKPWNDPSSVVICCGRCNSSRGKKKLTDWFNTKYCINNNINLKKVDGSVKRIYTENLKSKKFLI